jgi:hypothetical protein
MTDQQIRLHFGKLNASEMRLARAIVGWHERELASIIERRDSACASLQRHYETLRSLAVAIWRTNYADDAPQWEPLPDIDGIVSQIDNMAAGLGQQVAVLKWEQAKLRTAAEAMATSISSILRPGYSQGCNKPTEFEDRMLRSALAAYQATKP